MRSPTPNVGDLVDRSLLPIAASVKPTAWAKADSVRPRFARKPRMRASISLGPGFVGFAVAFRAMRLHARRRTESHGRPTLRFVYGRAPAGGGPSASRATSFAASSAFRMSALCHGADFGDEALEAVGRAIIAHSLNVRADSAQGVDSICAYSRLLKLDSSRWRRVGLPFRYGTASS